MEQGERQNYEIYPFWRVIENSLRPPSSTVESGLKTWKSLSPEHQASSKPKYKGNSAQTKPICVEERSRDANLVKILKYYFIICSS